MPDVPDYLFLPTRDTDPPPYEPHHDDLVLAHARLELGQRPMSGGFVRGPGDGPPGLIDEPVWNAMRWVALQQKK